MSWTLNAPTLSVAQGSATYEDPSDEFLAALDMALRLGLRFPIMEHEVYIRSIVVDIDRDIDVTVYGDPHPKYLTRKVIHVEFTL